MNEAELTHLLQPLDDGQLAAVVDELAEYRWPAALGGEPNDYTADPSAFYFCARRFYETRTGERRDLTSREGWPNYPGMPATVLERRPIADPVD
jgi:hypothetical protein